MQWQTANTPVGYASNTMPSLSCTSRNADDLLNNSYRVAMLAMEASLKLANNCFDNNENNRVTNANNISTKTRVVKYKLQQTEDDILFTKDISKRLG